MISVSNSFRSALLASAVAFCAAVTAGQAKPYTVVHDFAGAPNDGSYPFNDVSFDAAGNIYGTTNLGGGKDSGTVFKITPDGTETLLHSFDGGAGGSDPNAGVTIDPETGTFYGTTSFGGSAGACRGGCGVLYSLTSDGTYTVLHAFDNGVDGGNPGGQLVRDKQGNLFGVTVSSGPTGGGTLILGYQDDDYGDNGYWGHDDGTENQCKYEPNAWVEIYIRPGA